MYYNVIKTPMKKMILFFYTIKWSISTEHDGIILILSHSYICIM